MSASAPPSQYMDDTMRVIGLKYNNTSDNDGCGYNIKCKGSVTVCLCSVCKCVECDLFMPAICYIPTMIVIPVYCNNCVCCHPECVCCHR